MERLHLGAPRIFHPSTRRFGVSDYVNSMERLLQAVQDLSLARSLYDIKAIVRSSARELIGCDGADPSPLGIITAAHFEFKNTKVRNGISSFACGE